jgi:hypothetical protein
MMGAMKSVKVSISEDLEAWLSRKAQLERRPVSSMIRVLLYAAKHAEDAAQLEESSV